MSHPLPVEQAAICRALATQYPQLAMSIFSGLLKQGRRSEISHRLDSASAQNRASLLSLLSSWVENLELVDSQLGDASWEDGPRGWGSEEATQLLLNNLLYLTVSLSEEHENQVSPRNTKKFEDLRAVAPRRRGLPGESARHP